jgi:hypothetical protein
MNQMAKYIEQIVVSAIRQMRKIIAQKAKKATASERLFSNVLQLLL